MKAVVPGSFDPITNGHIDIIERAAYQFGEVVIGVAANPDKHPLFPIAERLELIAEAVSDIANVTVGWYEKLLVGFAQEHGASVIVRGLRAISDFEREFQIAQFNKKLDPSIETIFLMAAPEFMFLSSSAVKEVVRYGGSVSGLVPPNIEARLDEVFHPERRTK